MICTIKELIKACSETWAEEDYPTIQQQALGDLDQSFQKRRWRPEHFKQQPRARGGVDRGLAMRSLYLKRLDHNLGCELVPKYGGVKFRSARRWSYTEAASSAPVPKDQTCSWFANFTCLYPQTEAASAASSTRIYRNTPLYKYHI